MAISNCCHHRHDGYRVGIDYERPPSDAGDDAILFLLPCRLRHWDVSPQLSQCHQNPHSEFEVSMGQRILRLIQDRPYLLGLLVGLALPVRSPVLEVTGIIIALGLLANFSGYFKDKPSQFQIGISLLLISFGIAMRVWLR
ncbi:MAG: hypothetical protein AAB638_03290 [Patescibacteria group bacterium]